MFYKVRVLLLISIIIVCFVIKGKSQINYSEHIASIIYNKCASCHHSGGIAPFSLSSYEETKRKAAMILISAVDPKTRFMPPWMPDTSYSHFADERKLTESETTLIKQWIIDGMPQGNKAAEPELPVFTKGSQLGKPDLTVSMKQSFIHKGNNKDEYRIFVLPTNVTEEHNVSAIEIVPGNPKIAHHIILGLDTTNMGEKLDAKDEPYGYEQYSGFGFYPAIYNWSGWVPGNQTRFFPEGISNKVLPRSKVLLQIHYGPTPIDAKDSTTINVFYNHTMPTRYIQGWVLSPNDIKDGPFFLKANTTTTFHAQFKVVADWSLISVTPHSHWLGKKWEVYAVHPNGDTTHLIRIKDWDFNWQNFFSFKHFIHLEKGSIIYANATYDNTERNARNPNSPPKNVMWGESAMDEMFLFYFAYVPYQKGDEDVEIGGEVNYLDALYNKAKKSVDVNYSLTAAADVALKLVDSSGKVLTVDNFNAKKGKGIASLNASALKAGVYWCKITTANFAETRRVMVN